MKSVTRTVRSSLLLALLAVSLPAQTGPDEKAMSEALQARRDIAQAVAQGAEQPAAALGRLRAHPSPTGLRIDADADFAFAAVDIGQRLIAAQKPAEAEPFFKEAEKSLAQLMQRTPDSEAAFKAQCLGKLALVRARYLNKPEEAKAALDAAQKLRPDDAYLNGLRAALGNEHGRVFGGQPPKN